MARQSRHDKRCVACLPSLIHCSSGRASDCRSAPPRSRSASSCSSADESDAAGTASHLVAAPTLMRDASTSPATKSPPRIGHINLVATKGLREGLPVRAKQDVFMLQSKLLLAGAGNGYWTRRSRARSLINFRIRTRPIGPDGTCLPAACWRRSPAHAKSRAF